MNAATTLQSPTLSVIIPVYNGASTITDCLRALAASTYARYETIIVDDASTDGTIALLAGCPHVVLTSARNAGAAAARNRGATAARGSYLFFLDADILVEPDTLARVAARLERDRNVAAMFCSFQEGTVPANFVSDYKNLLHHHTHQTSHIEASTFCGGFGAVKRQVFEAIGGFDETYRSLEDVEFGYRLHQAGHVIRLDPSIQLTHCKHYTLAGLVRSDLFQRAIPWTQILLSKRIYRNDLNTRNHHVASVIVAWLMLVGLAALPLAPAWLAGGVVALVAVFVALNARFLSFLRARRGWAFAARSVVLCWFGCVYSGLGVAIGLSLALHSLSRERSRSPLAGGMTANAE